MANEQERVVFGRLPVDRGPYVGGTIYYPYNIVQNAGSTFMAITEGALAEPIASYDSIHDIYTVTEGWRLIALKGESDATFNTGEEVPDLGITQTVANGSGEDAKLPTSQAVFNYVMDNGVFDLTAYGNGTTYESLSAALTALNALPAAFKKGGMGLKFNQATPIKYSVVKITGLTTQPSGTELSTDPGVNSGTYTAAQLSAFSTLPATLNSSETYWMEVAGDTTTYTSWVITYAQSADNKYVQYRLMADEFSTTPSDWQGVDDKLIHGSHNIVEGGAVEEVVSNINKQINGNSIEQPTAQTMINGYITSDGDIYNGTNNRYIILDLSNARGCHITESTSVIQQYAFLVGYNDEKVTFVSGGGRISGTLNNTEIPSDANYLYIYIGGSSTLPTLTLPDAAEGIINEIEDINTEIGNINDDIDTINESLIAIDTIVDAVDVPAPIYKFVASKESKAVLNNNIVLETNGDSIEFVLNSCSFPLVNSANMAAHSFARNPNNASYIGISLARQSVHARSDDSTWLFQFNEAIENYFVGKTIKIVYENSVTNLYLNSDVIATYNGQKKLTIGSFGNGSTYGYWDGSVSEIKVNGVSINLKTVATLTNITVIQDIDFLSDQEKEQLYLASLPLMMVEKTATTMKVYKKFDVDYYIGYPLNYRQKAYSVGEYPSYYDNWGIGQVFLAKYENNAMNKVADLFQYGEAELAIRLERGDEEEGTVYVGGSAHGFENIKTGTDGREFIIMIDNTVYAESSVIPLRIADTICVIQGSELCQAYTNNNPFAYATKKWVFNAVGNLEITTKTKLLRPVTIVQGQFGMFCVYRHFEGNVSNDYLTYRAVKDDRPYKIFETEDGWESGSETGLKVCDFDCRKITEYGQYGLGFALAIKDDNTKPSGGMYVATNSNKYNKIYYSLCNNYETTTNEELYATQEWKIEGSYIVPVGE